MPPFKGPKLRIKIPNPIGNRNVKVALAPAGKKYLAARVGHPAFRPNPTITPATTGRLFSKTTTAGGGTKTKTAKTVDPMTRITNRLLADMLTPKEQRAQAQAGVDAQIKLALAGMRASTQGEQAQARQQAARAQQYALALGSMRDMSGAQIEADYTNAAQRVQGLGTGLTGTIAESQQAGANDAAARIAAATSGLGVAKGLDVEGLKNIAQYTGVTMPATDLYQEAASQAAQARLSQDTRAAEVGNLAQDYLQKGTDAQEELKRQRIALEATRPSLYQAAMSDIQGGGRSDMATIISALALANQTAKVPSEIKKNVAGANATTTRAGVDVGKQRGFIMVKGKPVLVKGFSWKGPGTKKAVAIPTGWMLDPKDQTDHKIIPNPKYGGKKGGDTAKDINALVKTWADKLDKEMDMDNSRYAENATDPIYEGVKPPQWVPKMSYAKAFEDLRKRLPPVLRNNKQMLANIKTSLLRVGYKVPKKTTTVTTTAKPYGQPGSNLAGPPSPKR